MVNLHERLKAYNEVAPDIQETLILKEAQNIYDNAAQEDLDVLHLVGLSKNIELANNIKRKNNQASSFKEVYDISAIENLAVDYRLRFLPASYYVGTIDPLLPTIIKSFIKDNNVDAKIKDDPYLYRPFRGSNEKFYILAPKQSFQLEERPKDPIMFYKINDEKFAFVHKWGNDLSSTRRIISFFKNYTYGFVLLAIALLPLILFELFHSVNLTAVFSALCTTAFLLFAVIGGAEGRWHHSNVWNSPFRD